MTALREPSNPNEQTTNNSGCGLFFVIACTAVLIAGLFTNTILIFCGIIGITIGFVIMASSTSSVQTTQTFYGIDQFYFTIVQEHGEKIYLFLKKISDDLQLKEQLNKRINQSLRNQFSGISFPNMVNTLMTADILKIYQQLNYQPKEDKKESFAMVYLLARILGLKIITFSELPIIYNKIIVSMSSYLPAIEQLNANYTNSNDLFILGKLLNDTDSEIGKEHYLLLYRYASIIAKADGTVTTKEADFLKSIMSPWNNNTNNSVTKTTSCTNIPIEQTGVDQLNQLIGLETVKNEIATLTNFIKIQNMRTSKGMKATSLSYHCVFTGNPGTGKTTVARILSCIYKEVGVLKKGHLVETDRSGLVAEYVGQTAVKTNKIIDSAMDGVLFIDEAYSLISNSSNDYGKEAIATLLKRMEDDRERLVVILAGYTNEMKNFIDSNPGLQSRFNRYIEFKDYSQDELLQIFLSNSKKYEYIITDEAMEKLKQLISKAIINKDSNFGNARWVRNIFEKTLELQANRLASEGNISNESLITITEQDILSEE